ncbi:MAG: P-loop NTPase fold protein [Pyrinomonadaceae bacterium]
MRQSKQSGSITIEEESDRAPSFLSDRPEVEQDPAESSSDPEIADTDFGFEESVEASSDPPSTPGDSAFEFQSSSGPEVAVGDPTQSPPVVESADPPAQKAAPANDNKSVLNANVGDQPTEVDTIGFGPYVDAIASFLTNEATKPPLTLSIEGEWGSGKSSFMLQLESRLKERKQKTVRFNAWRHDKDDAMWAAFALEFVRRLSKELTFRQRWLAHLKLVLQRFNWEKGWLDLARVSAMCIGLLVIIVLPFFVPYESLHSFFTTGGGSEVLLKKTIGVGGIAGYFAITIILFLKLKDWVGNPLAVNLKQHLSTPNYKSRIAFIEQFHDDFAKVVKAYTGDRKVYVFIDDLDRCEVPKAADLMQALNLMISDVSPLIFIIGMDREKVAAGLAVKFEKLLPYLAPANGPGGGRANAPFDPVVGLEYGYSFIEKFIQLPFLVPQASHNQLKVFLERIFSPTRADERPAYRQRYPANRPEGARAEEKVNENSEMVQNIVEMVAPTFEYNPRRLKQFVNTFRLKTYIASRTGLFDAPQDTTQYAPMTAEQLGKFVAIGLRWPLLLADLDADRDLLSKLQQLVLSDQTLSDLEKFYTSDTMVYGRRLSDAEMRWLRRENLVKLLRVGCDTADPPSANVYSLSNLNVNNLLQVSPLTTKTSPKREQSSGVPST